MGKTSVALTEYHKCKQRGEDVTILIPDKNMLHHLQLISNSMGITVYKTDIIAPNNGQTHMMGRRADRLIIDEIEWVVNRTNNTATPGIAEFLDNMFLVSDKILITSSVYFDNELQNYTRRRNIQYTYYNEDSLRGYQIGVK